MPGTEATFGGTRYAYCCVAMLKHSALCGELEAAHWAEPFRVDSELAFMHGLHTRYGSFSTQFLALDSLAEPRPQAQAVDGTCA